MSLEIETTGSSALIKIKENSLSGDIANEFKSKVVELIDKGTNKIELDLSNTNFIDSSGIGKLLFINKKIAQVGGVIEIIKITPTLYDFLESLTINKVITIKK